jgi:peptide/nickel transport system permease protein
MGETTPEVRPRRLPNRLRIPATGLTARICALVLGVIVLVAILAPWIAPHNPTTVYPLSIEQGPSSSFLLGTDGAGRDILSRLMVGSRTSLLGPLLIVSISTLAGSMLAILAAWFGGWFDEVVSRSVDALFAFPGVLLAIFASAVFGPGLLPAVVALSIAYTPYLARITRGAAVRERQLPYIDALEVQGLSAIRICTRHILPNLMPYIVAAATTAFGYAMIDLAAIDFLGFGVQPPTPDWGVMVSTGEGGLLQGQWEESLFAGAMIVVTVVAFNVLGEQLARRSRYER